MTELRQAPIRASNRDITELPVFRSMNPRLLIRFPLATVFALMTMAAGFFTAVAPLWVASVLIGAPAVLLAVVPRARYWTLLVIFALAPFMPFVKAFTGLRYGPLVLDVSLAVVMLGLVIDDLSQSRRFRLSWMEIGVLAFMLLGVLQLLNPLGPGLLVALEGYRVLVWQAVAYLLGRRMVLSKSQLHSLVILMQLVSALVALYAIKQFFLPAEIDERLVSLASASPITYTALGQNRAFSTMSGPFHLAYFMVAMLLLGVCWLEFSRRKSLILVHLGLLGFALLLTIVRTGWVGLLAGLVAGGVLKATHHRNVSLLITQVALASLAYVAVGYVLVSVDQNLPLAQRFQSLTSLSDDQHYQGRVESWIDTILPAIRENPLGYGVGSDTTSQSARFYSHNGYFYVAIEMGVPGLLLLLLILAGALTGSARIHSGLRDPLLRCLNRWTLSTWTALLVMATFGAFIEVYPVTLYMWFFLGLAREFPTFDEPPHRRRAALLAAGGVCV